MFVRKQAAQGVDNKQQPALSNRGFLDENPLALGFLAVRSDQGIGGDPSCAPLPLRATTTLICFPEDARCSMMRRIAKTCRPGIDLRS